MFAMGAATRIYLATGATDLRKSFTGLEGLIRERLECDPLTGHLFLFSNSRGGFAENIAVSNCLLSEVYGCPIKFHADLGSHFENISFSDSVLQNVTGPINFSVGPGAQTRRPEATSQRVAVAPDTSLPIVRNISLNNIQGTVTTDPAQLSETTLTSGYNSGERYSCITLNCVGGSTLENISFDNIDLTFGGGGTAEDAAQRDLPQLAGEYFALGPMPAFKFYARNARGITLQNIRFQVASPDLRPTMILDHMEDVAINGFSSQGNPSAESLLRFIDNKQVLLTAPRLLTPAAAFLQMEGTGNQQIVIDGGDLSKAAAALTFTEGTSQSSVKLRS